MCMRGRSVPQLGFWNLWRREGERVLESRGEIFIMFFFFFWNELGQGGDQERGEASLGVRRYGWSRVEVGKFDLC